MVYAARAAFAPCRMEGSLPLSLSPLNINHDIIQVRNRRAVRDDPLAQPLAGCVHLFLSRPYRQTPDVAVVPVEEIGNLIIPVFLPVFELAENRIRAEIGKLYNRA